MKLLNYQPDTGIFTWKVSKGTAKVGRKAGYYDDKGYLLIKIDSKIYKLHRLAFFYMTKCWPVVCDHKNRIKNDNRWENIRSCSKHQNNCNTDYRKDNTSGAKGVWWHKASNKWAASVRSKGKRYNLGLFSDIEFAELVVNSAREKLHGDYAS